MGHIAGLMDGRFISGSIPGVPLGCRGEINNTADVATRPFAAAPNRAVCCVVNPALFSSGCPHHQRMLAEGDATDECIHHTPPSEAHVSPTLVGVSRFKSSLPHFATAKPSSWQDRCDRYGAPAKAERLRATSYGGGQEPFEPCKAQVPNLRHPAGVTGVRLSGLSLRTRSAVVVRLHQRN